MSAFSDALLQANVKLTPLQQAGTDVALTWDTSTTGPILDDLVLVVLPDFHLANGGGGDIFRGTANTTLAKLLSLLNGLVSVSATFPNLAVVQLGDLYDVWRSYPTYNTHPTSDYSVIEQPYAQALGLLTEQLNARVCVGNHDGSLGVYPPAWARNADGTVNSQLAYGHLLSSSRVLAFHGHQEDTLNKAMAAQGGSDVVRLATEVARLSNPIGQAIQQGFEFVSDLFGDLPLSLADAQQAIWPQAAAPANARGFQSPRWSARDGTAVLQKIVQALPFAAGLRLVVVGHSHRAGISSIQVNDALVPLVDVGSWVWGQSQFAIVSEGELRLWQVQ